MTKTVVLKIDTFLFRGSEALYGAGGAFTAASGIEIPTTTEVADLPLVDTAELMRVDILARWNVTGKDANGRTKSIRVFSAGDPTGRTAFKNAVASGITYDGYTFKTATSSGRRQVLK